MSKTTRLVFFFLILFSVAHTIRDIFQIIGVKSWLTDVLNQKHNWCEVIAPVCDYYLFPWEIFVLIGSIAVLKRNKVGILGRLVLFSLVIWPIIWALNWTLG